MEKKVCYKCKEEKDITEFHMDTSCGEPYNCCKSCFKEYLKPKNNKRKKEERARKQGKAKKDNKEERKEKNKQYTQEHPEYKKQWRKNNQESIREYRKQWNKEHRDVCNVTAQRYRAKKKQLPNTLTKEQWDQCKQHFDNKCAYCGQELPLTQEHFIPVSKGGEYTHNNIVPACKICNCSKSNYDFRVWYLKYEHYDKNRERKILKYLGYEDKTQQLSMIAN